MGVRTRIHDGLTRVAKVFGPGVPESFQQGEAASQMTPASPFSPGTPIGPTTGTTGSPRAHDFVTGYNIATRPRTHERVSFETLKGLVESYDVAQICCIPGTEVITKRGLVPIEDVAVGDEVITHLGRWRRVTQTMVNRPHTPVRTLKTRGLEDLSVTGNHPVYAVDYWVTQTRKREARGIGWISADQLRPRGPRVSHSYDGLVLPALELPDGCPELDVAAIAGDGYVTDADGMLVRKPRRAPDPGACPRADGCGPWPAPGLVYGRGINQSRAHGRSSASARRNRNTASRYLPMRVPSSDWRATPPRSGTAAASMCA